VFSPSAITDQPPPAQLQLPMSPPTAEPPQPASGSTAASVGTAHAGGAHAEPLIPLHESVWPDDGPV
jgi:hypothetical protein